MSGFKDMVKADRRNVFLNFDEFGEEYTVEGEKIVIMIDTDELKARQGGEDLAVAESQYQWSRMPDRRLEGRYGNCNDSTAGKYRCVTVRRCEK